MDITICTVLKGQWFTKYSLVPCLWYDIKLLIGWLWLTLLQPPGGNSWLGALIATIIGNLKISLSNVHIRYEDSIRLVVIFPFCSDTNIGNLLISKSTIKFPISRL